MKNQIQELLQKDMSRHEFLATMGMGLVAMLGLTSALKFLLDTPTMTSGRSRNQSNGYGSSPYGR